MPASAGIFSYNRKREPGSRFRTNKDGNPRMNKDGNTHKYVPGVVLCAYHALTCKHICSYSLYNAEI